MKVVINSCYGGFSVSRECCELMEKLGCKQAAAVMKEWRKEKKLFDKYKETGVPPKGKETEVGFWDINIKYGTDLTFHGYGYCEGYDNGFARDNEYLVAAVEKLGPSAGGQYAELRVVEVPDGVEWHLEEYDGLEHIAENHRTWS